MDRFDVNCLWGSGWRCVNCGAVIDPVIHVHQQRGSTSFPDWHAHNGENGSAMLLGDVRLPGARNGRAEPIREERSCPPIKWPIPVQVSA
ncbi:MAG: hypothetical protein R3B95_04170 [Nitrospirales bacterium]|nr:hypothetical protein [Nitrospirales bacterium]